MKLLEKLRWLPTEIPWPGTADVSAKSWLLAVLVGDTPGTTRARSRKLRPFSGRFCTSACDTVPAICVRAVSTTAACAPTVTVLCSPATVSSIASSNAEPTVSITGRIAWANPGWLTVTSYAPTLRYGRRNLPSRSVSVAAVRLVSVRRALTCAPAITEPDGSVTRPLTLANVIVSCAYAPAPMKIKIAIRMYLWVKVALHLHNYSCALCGQK